VCDPVDAGPNRKQQRKHYDDADDAGQVGPDLPIPLQGSPVDDEVGHQPAQHPEDGSGCPGSDISAVAQNTQHEPYITSQVPVTEDTSRMTAVCLG